MRPHPGSHSRLRRIPSRPATGSGAAVEKALTMGPNFMIATGMGWGKLGKGWGARTPCAGIFSAAYPSSNPPPAPVSKSPASSPPLQLPAHQGTLSCHARVSGGAPRRRQSPGRRLAFPSPSIAERAPGPRAAGGPRHPQTVLRPHPAVLFPPGAPPVSETRKVLSPPACPRAPQTPMASAGNWQETPRCWRFGGALAGEGGSSRTRGIRDWRIRGLRGPGQAPVPGPQVHVKVRQQVPGA